MQTYAQSYAIILATIISIITVVLVLLIFYVREGVASCY